MSRNAARAIGTGVVALAMSAGASVLAQPAAAPASQTPLNDKSLEELMSLDVASVTGAARHEQRVTEAPSSVTVVTAADIRTFGWRTLADVLRSVRGFYVTNDRNYSYVGVRAFGRPTDYNNRILVIVDGHRLNDNVYDAVGLGTEGPVDLDLVDRIEVIRGPGSALYGTSAFFAVLNIVTRRGGAVGGVEVGAEAGTLETFGGRLTLGRSWTDGRDLTVSVRGLSSGGVDELYYPEFDSPETFSGRAIGMDADRSGSVFASASAAAWTFHAAYRSRTKRVPTASWGTRFGDDRYRTTDSRAWFDASRELSLGQTTITVRTYADWMGYSGIYPFDAGSHDQNLDRADGTWLGGEVTAAREVGRHRLIGGVEHRYNARQAQKNRVDGGDVYIDDVRQSHQSAVFVHDEVAVTARLTAVLGARVDWLSEGHQSVRPRVGLIYRTDADMALKLLYGEAFRAANVYEKYFTEDTSLANPNLRPERIRTTEAVFEKYLRGRFRFTASAFITGIDDLIDQGGDAQVIHVNRGSVGAAGVEGEVEYRSAAGVLLRGSVVAQRSRDRETGGTLSNAPARLGTLQVAVPVATRALTAAVDASIVGSRKTRTGRELDAFALANVVVTWEPRGSGLRLQGGIYNLFDTEYQHPVGTEFLQDAIAQDRRTSGMRVTVRF